MSESQSTEAGDDAVPNATFLERAWESIFPSSLQRLRNALPGFREELKQLSTEAAGESSPWKDAADRLLRQAEDAVHAGDTERGWQCLNAAGRFMLYGIARLDGEASQSLLMVQATIIANAAADDKRAMPKWRRDCINDLLPKDESGKLKPIRVENLVEAKRTLDEYNDNVYRRLSILKSRLSLLTVAGVIFLAAWLFVFKPPVPDIVVSPNAGHLLASAEASAATVGAGGEITATGALSPSVDTREEVTSTTALARAGGTGNSGTSAQGNTDKFWWTIVLAGVLGGLISAITSAIRSDIRKSNIPAELATTSVTFSRLMLSALSALAVNLFLTSGLLSSIQLSYEMLIAVAVVSGFTDRLLLRAIEQASSSL